MTSGPAARLLAAFASLAGAWLAADKARCEVYGGRFDDAELERVSLKAPAARAGCLAIASAQDDGGAVLFDFRLAAIVIGRRDSRGEHAGGQAARLAARLAFELAREQVGPDGSELWPLACFSAEEIRAGRGGRDLGEPREVRAANHYSRKLDQEGIALWAVTWTQQFRAVASDFDLPLPEPAGIPDTALSGFAPDIGAAHAGDYGTVVAPEGG